MRGKARVSSAALSRVGDVKQVDSSDDGWQSDAYSYNELIGEVGYVDNLTANTVAACDLMIVRRSESGKWEESTDPRAQAVMDAFVGPRGGLEELLRRAALHMQIAGESWLAGEQIEDEHGRPLGILWEFLSTEEIKVVEDGKVQRNRSGASNSGYKRDAGGFVDLNAYVARLWRSDPRFSARADSPLRRVLTIAREVIVLTQVVDAIAKSRLSAGILFIPDEMSFGPDDEVEDPGDDTDDIDEFMQELISHLRSPVDDRTSAAALVPLLLRGAADLGDKVKLIDLARDLDEMYQNLRAEALVRLARGMDIPPEMMEGKGGLNHWTGYNIDSEFASKHVIPLGNMIAEFITSAYFRPMLVEFENFSELQAESFSLRFDPSNITAQPDARAVREGYDRGVVNVMTYLRSLGLNEEALPSEEEASRLWLEKVLEADPAIYGPIILPYLYPELEDLFGGGGSNSDLVDEVQQARKERGTRGPRPEVDGPRIDENPTLNPSDGMDEPEQNSDEGDLQSLIDRLSTAADAALERALERAANRVLSKMDDKDPQRREMRSLAKPDVLSALGKKKIAEMGVDDGDLLEGAWDSFRMKANVWMRRHLTAVGLSDFAAEEQANAACNELVKLLQGHALSAMRRPIRRGRNGLLVPDELVRSALEAA
jgi:hypothetical protein